MKSSPTANDSFGAFSPFKCTVIHPVKQHPLDCVGWSFTYSPEKLPKTVRSRNTLNYSRNACTPGGGPGDGGPKASAGL